MNDPIQSPAPPPFLTPEANEPIDYVITPKGTLAAAQVKAPSDCDVCRRTLQTGDAFYRVTLGMDDTPSYVGARLDRECTVEETSELTVCETCEPAVSPAFEAFLASLWAMRKADPVEEVPEPQAETTRSGDAIGRDGAQS